MVQELHRIMLLGAPGSGKGTQAMLISKRLGIPQISTGDILRQEIRLGSSVGLEAARLVAEGHLVPDRIVIEIVKKRLQETDCKDGYILDGFPRTLNQARAVDANDIPIDQVLVLDVDDGVILRRLSGRRVCSVCNTMFHVYFNPPKVAGLCDRCGKQLIIRKDDEEATIKRRLEIYHQETEPVIEYYREHNSVRFHRIDAGKTDNDSPEVIEDRIRCTMNQEYSQ